MSAKRKTEMTAGPFTPAPTGRGRLGQLNAMLGGEVQAAKPTRAGINGRRPTKGEVIIKPSDCLDVATRRATGEIVIGEVIYARFTDVHAEGDRALAMYASVDGRMYQSPMVFVDANDPADVLDAFREVQKGLAEAIAVALRERWGADGPSSVGVTKGRAGKTPKPS